MDFDHGYIEDTIRELLDELHDYLTDDFVKGKPTHIQEELKQVRERCRPFLGNLTPDDINLIEDFSPKLFDTYNGKAPLKDVIRGFIDAFYQYRMIYSHHHLHNELKYAIEPKFAQNKSREVKIEMFRKKLKEIYDLMGGVAYPRNEYTTPLFNELEKAYKNANQYVPEYKIKKPTLKTGFKKWLLSLKLPNKNDVINEFIKSIKE